jgi:alpha-glucosidase
MWWQTGIIYQIYPNSFQDSNGDGIGDMAGITRRLDYLAWLGIDAIWISPCFPSPLKDCGYDVSNFTDIHPDNGTLADFDALLEKAHSLKIKVLLDYVINHSSDQHPWFIESRSSRDNPKRDWYTWRDPAPDGGPPNNWGSYFGGPAWTLDETTGQYYLHTFLPAQPDINWRNPEAAAAMLDAARFWLERGVDGFRVDAVHCVGKAADFRDDPVKEQAGAGMVFNKRGTRKVYSVNQPFVHDVLRDFRKLLDEYDAFAVGEGPSHDYQNLFKYQAPDELHMAFNFPPMRHAFKANLLRDTIAEFEDLLPPHIWPNYVFGNHDTSRLANRIGPENLPLLAVLLLTLRGTPFIYYGEEIGMQDVPVPDDMLRDTVALNGHFNRDQARTPMQWDDGPNAGFTAGDPWLPIADNYRRCNVTAQRSDTTSLLSLYRRLIRLRREHAALTTGRYDGLPLESDDVLAYIRADDDQQFLIVLNFAGTEQVVDLPLSGPGQVVLSTYHDRAERIDVRQIFLRPHEACILMLDTK